MHAGKDAPREVVDQAVVDWINVMAGGSTVDMPMTWGASTQTQGGQSQAPVPDLMQHAMQDLDRQCGERYRSGFADTTTAIPLLMWGRVWRLLHAQARAE